MQRDGHMGGKALKINEEKTKIMRIDKECKKKKIQIGGCTFGEVEKF